MAKTKTEVQGHKPAPTTYNHCGVIIRIPNTNRFEATLEYRSQTYTVGLKKFGDFDQFKLYCENAAMELRQLVDCVARCETELETNKRVLSDRINALGAKDGR